MGMELNWIAKSISDIRTEVYAETIKKDSENGLTLSTDFPNLANFCCIRFR